MSDTVNVGNPSCQSIELTATTTTITGDATVTGDADIQGGLTVDTAASGTFITSDKKTVTVVKGIIVSIVP